MVGLFDRVFKGSDEMFAKAEEAVNKAVADLGVDAPITLPDTAYYLACIYCYLGIKVTTLGELKAALTNVKAMMTREYKTKDIFTSGVGTAISAEIIEACKYAYDPDPYKDTKYHGHFVDSEVRTLGVPLVTRDIPGFVVMIGPAPSAEEAAEICRGYQARGIFVFLLGGIIDQLEEAGVNMGYDVRLVPVGPDIWGVGHIISLVVRASKIFGNVEFGDYDGYNAYTIDRIFAFVNAYAPVDDITVACGAGAIQMGFPVITNDTKDMWPIPKSLIINTDHNNWIETSLEARDIKIKVTKVDIPVSYGSAFDGEIIRRSDMQIEVDGSRVDCCEYCKTVELSDIEDHRIILEGPDFDEFDPGARISLTITVELNGKNWHTDFEPVVERKFHHFINCAEGVMHTGQRDMIRVRVSKDAYEKGFRAKHLGEILWAKVMEEYDAVVDKCQIRINTTAEGCKAVRDEANEAFAKRDERLRSVTDESVDNFYTCILCQAFSPSHVCIVTPERLGLCGAVSWFDAKATHELDPSGPCQVVTKEHCIDPKLGSYEDVNEAIKYYSHGALEKVTLYSIMEDPMTSCGCFECICGIEPMSNGVVITNREHSGMTPLGMTFSEMAAMTGGGVQTPGFMGHGKQFIASKKFIAAEGGMSRIVWLPKALKEQLRDKINETAKELYGIESFADMIADETITTDIEDLMSFLSEHNHPVLNMEPMM